MGKGRWGELHPSRQHGYQKREEGNQLMMMSQGVEISIAGDVKEMVPGSYPWVIFFHFFILLSV